MAQIDSARKRASQFSQALGEDMKYIALVLTALFAALTHADETISINQNGINLSSFTLSDYPNGGQCGCWFHYPNEKKHRGKVIALGDAGDDAIYIIIDGKKTKIGNWKANYGEDRDLISYRNSSYKIDIISKPLRESDYSSDYQSTITIQVNSSQAVIEAFGSCGC